MYDEIRQTVAGRKTSVLCRRMCNPFAEDTPVIRLGVQRNADLSLTYLVRSRRTATLDFLPRRRVWLTGLH